MVKKLKKLAEQKAASPAGLLEGELAGAIKDSAQQIWLAGMGAFAKAQEGGQKVYEALVKEGMSLQRRTQSAAEDKIGEVAGKVTAMAEDVGSKAGQHWDKLEGLFEQRTARAMAKLGVPTAKDVKDLAARVDALAAAVAKLSKGNATPAAKPAAKAAPKPAAKTAPKTTAKPAPKTAVAPARKRTSKA